MSRAARTEYERTHWQPRWRRARVEEVQALEAARGELEEVLRDTYSRRRPVPNEEEAFEVMMGWLEEQGHAALMVDLPAVRALTWLIRCWGKYTGLDAMVRQAAPNAGVDKMAYGGMPRPPTGDDQHDGAPVVSAIDWPQRLIELGWTPPSEPRQLPGDEADIVIVEEE